MADKITRREVLVAGAAGLGTVAAVAMIAGKDPYREADAAGFEADAGVVRVSPPILRMPADPQPGDTVTLMRSGGQQVVHVSGRNSVLRFECRTNEPDCLVRYLCQKRGEWTFIDDEIPYIDGDPVLEHIDARIGERLPADTPIAEGWRLLD